MIKEIYKFNPDYDINIGEYINELLKFYNMNEEDLSNKMQLSLKEVKCIIDGLNPITLKIANKLSTIFNNTPEYWLNLQKYYSISDDLQGLYKDIAREQIKTIERLNKIIEDKE